MKKLISLATAGLCSVALMAETNVNIYKKGETTPAFSIPVSEVDSMVFGEKPGRPTGVPVEVLKSDITIQSVSGSTVTWDITKDSDNTDKLAINNGANGGSKMDVIVFPENVKKLTFDKAVFNKNDQGLYFVVQVDPTDTRTFAAVNIGGNTPFKTLGRKDPNQDNFGDWDSTYRTNPSGISGQQSTYTAANCTDFVVEKVDENNVKISFTNGGSTKEINVDLITANFDLRKNGKSDAQIRLGFITGYSANWTFDYKNIQMVLE